MTETEALRAGADFFNAGDYFQAHEVWEDLWRVTKGPARIYYQGLIHAAVGLHHLAGGNIAGATSQVRKAISRLEQGSQTVSHLDTARLISELRLAIEKQSLGVVRIVPLN